MKLMSLLQQLPPDNASEHASLEDSSGHPRHVRDQALGLGRGSAPYPGVETWAGASVEEVVRWRSDPARAVAHAVADVWLSEHVVTGLADLFDGPARRQQAEGAVKVVAFLVRRAGSTTEEFAAYWLDRHAPLALEIVPPNTFGYAYVQNHAVSLPDQHGDVAGNGTGGGDGVAELYFRDHDHMMRWARWLSSEDGARLRADEYEFMDPEQRIIVAAREHVLAP